MSRPDPAESKLNDGRLAAIQALLSVERGRHGEDALADGLGSMSSTQDKALAWFLTLGVLRRRSHVDAALRPLLRQPLDGLDAPVRAILRCGAYERLYARTPPHAVVHQFVEAAPRLQVGRAKGLINAVLRRVTAPDGLSRAEHLDHPDWLVERWTSRYGRDAVDRWCEQNNEPPPLSIVTRSDGDTDRLRAAGVELSPVVLRGAEIPRCFRVVGHQGSPTALPGFAEGWWWVQDPASVIAADELGVQPGELVLDACAAPGGKAFRMTSQGGAVRAIDVEPDRLRLLSESAERLGYAIPVRAHDWAVGPIAETRRFAAILLDAPCTALGTARRHPEVRWRRVPDDIPAQAKRQSRILAHVSDAVAPGGRLVYSVCSPEPEEGVGVIDRFISENDDFEVEATGGTAPPEHDEDAFWFARLRRRA